MPLMSKLGKMAIKSAVSKARKPRKSIPKDALEALEAFMFSAVIPPFAISEIFHALVPATKATLRNRLMRSGGALAGASAGMFGYGKLLKRGERLRFEDSERRKTTTDR